MCSVVAKVYQLWGAARGSFWEVGGGEVFFVILGFFKHWNQRPNNKQPLLFKVKFMLFTEYTCMVYCLSQFYDYLYTL